MCLNRFELFLKFSSSFSQIYHFLTCTVLNIFEGLNFLSQPVIIFPSSSKIIPGETFQSVKRKDTLFSCCIYYESRVLSDNEGNSQINRPFFTPKSKSKKFSCLSCHCLQPEKSRMF